MSAGLTHRVCEQRKWSTQPAEVAIGRQRSDNTCSFLDPVLDFSTGANQSVGLGLFW